MMRVIVITIFSIAIILFVAGLMVHSKTSLLNLQDHLDQPYLANSSV